MTTIKFNQKPDATSLSLFRAHTRHVLYQVLEDPQVRTAAAHFVRWMITGLVAISTACVCLETVEEYGSGLRRAFDIAEIVFVAVFSSRSIFLPSSLTATHFRLK
jgi:hypothetical protein